ncbi:heavy-metal-associated domain-containing protein [Arthrobacter sp. B2a2-09]|uniref:heavy-metal-associated domain-containing protein n=1 Tax=Arthrobacter sp. B2a2-09 TaxID=2952822 RepID=UPI0022CD9BD5|nr:heavy-metal-associated domain-containing protein [Arthrobacter sp. B2a2-09]MCZ9880188.1 heavy-metal-associated domain-containing protein [Arthrobacter sp. B2a2-09]
MCGTESRTLLPLASSASGFSCCSSETPTRSAAGASTEYGVEGLTCGHCVQTVQDAVTAVEGVDSASVALVAGGVSRLFVSGSPADAAVRGAVTAAGYALSTR